MAWDYLKNIKLWTPLESIELQSLEKIEDNLYRVDKEVFLVAQPYDQTFVEGLPGAPFVTLIYWAVSSDAVRRCLLRGTDSDFPEINPPPELSLGTNGTYAELQELAGPSCERAIYDGASGAFLHKLISINEYEFFFLSRGDSPAEKPFAIEFRLSG